jgi:hypothetical protein
MHAYRVYTSDNDPIRIELANFSYRMGMLKSSCASTRAGVVKKDGGVLETGRNHVWGEPFNGCDKGVRGVGAALLRVA